MQELRRPRWPARPNYSFIQELGPHLRCSSANKDYAAQNNRTSENEWNGRSLQNSRITTSVPCHASRIYRDPPSRATRRGGGRERGGSSSAAWLTLPPLRLDGWGKWTRCGRYRRQLPLFPWNRGVMVEWTAQLVQGSGNPNFPGADWSADGGTAKWEKIQVHCCCCRCSLLLRRARVRESQPDEGHPTRRSHTASCLSSPLLYPLWFFFSPLSLPPSLDRPSWARVPSCLPTAEHVAVVNPFSPAFLASAAGGSARYKNMIFLQKLGPTLSLPHRSGLSGKNPTSPLISFSMGGFIIR